MKIDSPNLIGGNGRTLVGLKLSPSNEKYKSSSRNGRTLVGLKLVEDGQRIGLILRNGRTLVGLKRIRRPADRGD